MATYTFLKNQAKEFASESLQDFISSRFWRKKKFQIRYPKPLKCKTKRMRKNKRSILKGIHSSKSGWRALWREVRRMDGMDIFKKQNGKSRIPKTLKRHSRKTTGKRKGRSESFKAIDPAKNWAEELFCQILHEKNRRKQKCESFVNVYYNNPQLKIVHKSGSDFDGSFEESMLWKFLFTTTEEIVKHRRQRAKYQTCTARNLSKNRLQKLVRQILHGKNEHINKKKGRGLRLGVLIQISLHFEDRKSFNFNSQKSLKKGAEELISQILHWKSEAIHSWKTWPLPALRGIVVVVVVIAVVAVTFFFLLSSQKSLEKRGEELFGQILQETTE